MSLATHRRLGAALLLLGGLVVSACGGGEPDETTAGPSAAATSTLLDDDGSPMPSVSAAGSADARSAATPRHATEAQANDLQRALGASARRVEVSCCGAAAAEAAVGSVLAPDGTLPLAVLLNGQDTAAVLAAAERLQTAGLERVWVVIP